MAWLCQTWHSNKSKDFFPVIHMKGWVQIPMSIIHTKLSVTARFWNNVRVIHGNSFPLRANVASVVKLARSPIMTTNVWNLAPEWYFPFPSPVSFQLVGLFVVLTLPSTWNASAAWSCNLEFYAEEMYCIQSYY